MLSPALKFEDSCRVVWCFSGVISVGVVSVDQLHVQFHAAMPLIPPPSFIQSSFLDDTIMPCKPFWGPKIVYLTCSCLECIYSFVCIPKMLWKPICHLKDQIRHINKMVPPWFRLALFFVLQESKCHHLCHEVVFWSCYCLGKSSLSLSLTRETLKIFNLILQSYLLNFLISLLYEIDKLDLIASGWSTGISALEYCPKK